MPASSERIAARPPRAAQSREQHIFPIGQQRRVAVPDFIPPVIRCGESLDLTSVRENPYEPCPHVGSKIDIVVCAPTGRG